VTPDAAVVLGPIVVRQAGVDDPSNRRFCRLFAPFKVAASDADKSGVRFLRPVRTRA